MARLDKLHDLKKAHKDFKKFIKSRIVADQIKDDCPWSKEDDNKRKKKMYGNVHIDEIKRPYEPLSANTRSPKESGAGSVIGPSYRSNFQKQKSPAPAQRAADGYSNYNT